MPPKRKNTDNAAAMDRPEKKTKAPKKGAKAAPEVYTAQQKAAIQQFISFTQLDKSTAVRALKSHGWDAQNAVNATINTVDDERLSSGNTATSSDSTASSIETYTVKGAFQPRSVPHLVEGLDCLQTEQHRVQAEHLSRVLHSSLSLTNVTNAPESQFALARHVRYSSLGTDSVILQHPRSITAPLPTTSLPQTTLEDLLELLHTTTVPPLRTSVSDHHLGSEPTVSLRGGSGIDVDSESHSNDYSERDISGRRSPQVSDTAGRAAFRAFEIHLFKCVGPMDHASYVQSCQQETRRYKSLGIPQMWPRIEQAYLPITVGVHYNMFLQRLSPPTRILFAKLFGLLPLGHHTKVSDNFSNQLKLGRLAFFHRLGPDGRAEFCNIIIERMNLVTGAEELPVLSDATSSPIDTVHLFVTAKLYYSTSNSGGSQGSSAMKTNLNKLFDRYQEAGAPDKDIVGVEGTMRYFDDTGVDAEGLDALAALEIVQAPTMGEMSRDGFVKGWMERHCDTIDRQKSYLKILKSELSGNKDVFTRVYKYTFTIAKTADQRAVPLEMATVYWELLFSSPLSAVQWSSPNTPWLTWWTEFLNTSWKKSVNKDMWNETLKFAQLSLEDETMGFWNEESSWPSVIDDFVEFVKKEKRGDTGEQPMDEDYY
ncbi:uncharacterized protein J4E88_000400 [Alternaria novae-zelandiae]|uniref:uncharacterized protein n=1 Tax=Alternaria novae-zelandiae TaxID=430562 RepID=UPI0020C41E42|nr:uncharacterized protein J4E88_000400 [Alternaria novae-zelandiae]KAI4696227.1 hypothetical protein J4E88_000400 [Alternaria novae-zelandiae]